MNFYKRYMGDYLSKTSRLSWTEDLAYRRLLDEYYATEKPLPFDKKECYNAARCMSPGQRRAVDKVLDRYFVLQDDGYHNRKADHLIEEATTYSDSQRAKGKKGGRPRKSSSLTGDEPGISRGLTGDEPGISRGKANHSQIPEATARSHSQKPQPRLEGPPVVVEVPTELEASVQSQTAVKPSAGPLRKKLAKNQRPAKSAETWKAYSLAYRNRYGVDPTRNATVNGQMAQFITRVPLAEAPAIAQFYVGHNDAYYVKQAHSVGLLLANAEKLRTEWQTGRVVTGARARQVERTATNFQNSEEAMEILRRVERERTGKAETLADASTDR